MFSDQRGVSRRAALRLAGAAAVSGAAVSSMTAPTDAQSAPGQELTGSWMSGVEVLGARLVIYHADGTLIATQAELRTPQIGSWVRTGDREFLVRGLSYRLAQDGSMLGSYDVRLDLTVDPAGASYGGPLVQREYDLSGNLVNTVNSSVAATRILPMAL